MEHPLKKLAPSESDFAGSIKVCRKGFISERVIYIFNGSSEASQYLSAQSGDKCRVTMTSRVSCL